MKRSKAALPRLLCFAVAVVLFSLLFCSSASVFAQAETETAAEAAAVAPSDNDAAAAASSPLAANAFAPSPAAAAAAADADAAAAAIAETAAAVDRATVDALLRARRSSVSSGGGGGGGDAKETTEEAGKEGDASPSSPSSPSPDAAQQLPSPAPPLSFSNEEEAAAEADPTRNSLAHESQEAYRSYRGLVPGSRLARLAPPDAFPGSPPARAESSSPSSDAGSSAISGGKATLTGPGGATADVVATTNAAAAASSSSPSPSPLRGKGSKPSAPPAPLPSSSPKGDNVGNNNKRIWSVDVDASATRQRFEGWGTSLAWWAVVVGSFPEAVRSKVADLMFDASKGLGLEVVRYNIGGSGNRDGIANWECPGRNDMRPGGAVPSFLRNDWKTYDWSVDAGQRWTLLAAKERGASVFEAFSNSPPCFMTSSGYASGNWDASNDNLPPKNYAAFASYLADVVSFYRNKHNVTFRTLDPFNEPATNYWYAGNAQEGCHFDRASQSAFLPVMAAALRARGLDGETQLSASDETCIACAEESLRAYAPDALATISQVNTHAYWGPSYPRTRLGDGARRAGKRLWQSEYGAGAAPPWEMPDALSMGAQVSADLNVMGAQAWVYWQAVEDLDGKPPTPWWGLAQLSFGKGGSGLRTGKQFWALSQFSRSIRSGATVLASPRPADTVVALQPSRRSGGKGGSDLVVVMTNVENQEAAAALDVSSFLPPSSPYPRNSDGGDDAVVARVKSWRTSSTEDRADAGEVSLRRSWAGKFDVRLAPESITTVVVSLA